MGVGGRYGFHSTPLSLSEFGNRAHPRVAENCFTVEFNMPFKSIPSRGEAAQMVTESKLYKLDIPYREIDALSVLTSFQILKTSGCQDILICLSQNAEVGLNCNLRETLGCERLDRIDIPTQDSRCLSILL